MDLGQWIKMIVAYNQVSLVNTARSCTEEFFIDGAATVPH